MEKLYNPKVSIIIPVYNGANFLSEAIDSALGQTYKNIEIIVVNDGSTDNGETEKIAKSYGEKIRYFSKENGGVSSALNFGIRQMTGDWFSWLSHDDLYMPQKIEHSINVLRSYSEDKSKLIVYTDGSLVRENRTKLRDFKRWFIPGKIYSGLDAAIAMSQKGTLCGCCLLIHRNAFNVVGGFDEALRYSQDALMWYQLFMKGYSICACDNNDVLSRVHKKQVTYTRKDLFVQDSLYVAKILAPIFYEKQESNKLYYNYVSRLTKLNCKKTVEYLINFSKEKVILTKFQHCKLWLKRKGGRLIYEAKTFARKLISR